MSTRILGDIMDDRISPGQENSPKLSENKKKKNSKTSQIGFLIGTGLWEDQKRLFFIKKKINNNVIER